MKRTKKISKLGMDGSIIQHTLEFKTKSPKKYVQGHVITDYLRERNQNWLNDNPKVLDETKQQILKENRF